MLAVAGESGMDGESGVGRSSGSTGTGRVNVYDVAGVLLTSLAVTPEQGLVLSLNAVRREVEEVSRGEIRVSEQKCFLANGKVYWCVGDHGFEGLGTSYWADGLGVSVFDLLQDKDVVNLTVVRRSPAAAWFLCFVKAARLPANVFLHEHIESLLAEAVPGDFELMHLICGKFTRPLPDWPVLRPLWAMEGFVMMAAERFRHVRVLEFAAPEVRDDTEVVRCCVGANVENVLSAGPTAREDKNIWLTVLGRGGCDIWMSQVPEQLQGDRDIQRVLRSWTQYEDFCRQAVE